MDKIKNHINQFNQNKTKTQNNDITTSISQDQMNEDELINAAKEYVKNCNHDDSITSRFKILIKNAESTQNYTKALTNLCSNQIMCLGYNNIDRLKDKLVQLDLSDDLIKKIYKLTYSNYNKVLFTKDEIYQLKNGLINSKSAYLIKMGKNIDETPSNKGYIEDVVEEILTNLADAKKSEPIQIYEFCQDNFNLFTMFALSIAVNFQIAQQFITRNEDTMMTVGSLGANVMAAIYVSFEIFDALIDQMIERADALVITQHNDNKNDKINSSNFMSMRVQVCEEVSGIFGAMAFLLSIFFGVLSGQGRDTYSFVSNLLFGAAALRHWQDDCQQAQDLEKLRAEHDDLTLKSSTISHILRRTASVGFLLSGIMVFIIGVKLGSEMTHESHIQPMNQGTELAIYVSFQRITQVLCCTGVALALTLFINQKVLIAKQGMTEVEDKDGLDCLLEYDVEDDDFDYSAPIDSSQVERWTPGLDFQAVLLIIGVSVQFLINAMLGTNTAWARFNNQNKSLISNKWIKNSYEMTLESDLEIIIPWDTFTISSQIKEQYFEDLKSKFITDTNENFVQIDFIYQVKQSNGEDLPSWMKFDHPDIEKKTPGKLYGKASQSGQYGISVNAQDTFSGFGSQQLFVHVLNKQELRAQNLKVLTDNNNYVGPQDWKDFFGCNETDYPDLPDNIDEILMSQDPFTNSLLIRDTHLLFFMPQTCNGIDVTVDSQANPISGLWANNTSSMPNNTGALIHDYAAKFEGANAGFEDAWVKRTVNRHEYILIYTGNSGMENGSLPGIRNKPYAEQIVIFDTLNAAAGNLYTLPVPLEIISGVMMKYIKTGDQILTYKNSQKATTTTNTSQVWDDNGYGAGERVVVGFFTPTGLFVGHVGDSLGFLPDDMGAMRKLM